MIFVKIYHEHPLITGKNNIINENYNGSECNVISISIPKQITRLVFCPNKKKTRLFAVYFNEVSDKVMKNIRGIRWRIKDSVEDVYYEVDLCLL